MAIVKRGAAAKKSLIQEPVTHAIGLNFRPKPEKPLYCDQVSDRRSPVSRYHRL
jgi:hypothetical protein